MTGVVTVKLQAYESCPGADESRISIVSTTKHISLSLCLPYDA